MRSSVTVESTALFVVWDTFADAKSPGRPGAALALEVWDLSDDLWAPAATLSFRLKMANVGVPFSVVVTESDPPHRISWASTKFSITATRTLQFAGDGASTEVADSKEFASPILPVRLFYPRPIIRRMTESWLEDLKAEAERRAD